jgi:succinate-semialdehyde dehydrogenase/glutarate-semialdehyde dehydrogenase
VFDDADIDSAVEGAMVSKYRNAGQTCVCANRFYVQAGVYDAFVEKLAAKAAGIKVGNGFEAGVNQGPLIDDQAHRQGRGHVADALAKGATRGGGRHAHRRTLLHPHRAGRRDRRHAVRQGRDLRPGGAGVPLRDRGRGHRLANATEFGLASYFYSRDIGRIFRVAKRWNTAWWASTPA